MKRRRHTKKQSGIVVWVIIGVVALILFGRSNTGSRQSSSPVVQQVSTVTRSATDSAATIIAGDKPMTATPSKTITPTPLPTAEPSVFYYVVAVANARECPKLSCKVITALQQGDQVEVINGVGGDTVSGNANWFEAIVDEQVVYVHSSLLSENKPVVSTPRPFVQPAATQRPVATQAQPAAQQYPRPRTCETAVAYGLGEAEIAQRWPHLDRNKNGVACYGS